MTFKTFERPLIDLSHELVWKHAQVVNGEYKISIHDLTEYERKTFIVNFLKSINSLDAIMQQYLDDAASDRTYAEAESLWSNYEQD